MVECVSGSAEWLAAQVREALSISDDTAAEPTRLLEELTVDGIVRYIRSGRCKKILTMAGAGISTCKWRSMDQPGWRC